MSCCSEEPNSTTSSGVQKSYAPVVAIFSVSFFTAIIVNYSIGRELSSLRTIELFVAFSMVILGTQKLQNLQQFVVSFQKYDLIARRDVRYGYVYPFVETGAGILMIGGLLTWVAAPAALIVSTIGAVSVFKAVYLEKKDLQCACTGGGDGVPLGFISLTENLMMMAMAVWMMVQATLV